MLVGISMVEVLELSECKCNDSDSTRKQRKRAGYEPSYLVQLFVILKHVFKRGKENVKSKKNKEH